MKQDVAAATRFKRTYRGDNLYVICVYNDQSDLAEICLLQSTGSHENACTTSGLEFVAALVNEMLSAGKIDRLKELAVMCSLGSRTLPGIIHQILDDHYTIGGAK